MSRATKISKFFFGLEVRIDALPGGGARLRIFNGGTLKLDEEAASIPAGIEAGWRWCCMHRPITLRIAGDLVEHRLEYIAPGEGFPGTIFTSSRRAEVEEAEVVFRGLLEEQWCREMAEHLRLAEQYPGRRMEIQGLIDERETSIAAIKAEVKALFEELRAADAEVYRPNVSDDTIAELGARMARRISGGRFKNGQPAEPAAALHEPRSPAAGAMSPSPRDPAADAGGGEGAPTPVDPPPASRRRRSPPRIVAPVDPEEG